MSRGDRIKKFLRQSVPGVSRVGNLEVDCMPPTGDCFYYAVENALSNAGAFIPHYSTKIVPDISFLRNIVAQSVSDTVYETYGMYHSCGIEGYEFMKDVHSVEQLKDQIAKSGKQVSRNACIWADHFAVQCISNCFQIAFLVFNEQDTITKTMIKPDQEEITEFASTDIIFVVLYLTRRNHYNLIGWKQPGAIVQFCFAYDQLPSMIHEAFMSSSPDRTAADSVPPTEPEPSVEVPSGVWDTLPDCVLQYFFQHFFTEQQRKFWLANVCDRWGRLIWNDYHFSPFYQRNQDTPQNAIPQKTLTPPAQQLEQVAVQVPHVRSLIKSVWFDHFQRGWMESVLALSELQEFHFEYGQFRKFHLQNPDLKLLLRSASDRIRVIRIQPNLSLSGTKALNSLRGCGFRAFRNCKQIEEVHICLLSDTTNHFLSSVPTTKLNKLVLYDSSKIDMDVMKKFLERDKGPSDVGDLEITLYDSSLTHQNCQDLSERSRRRPVHIQLRSLNNIIQLPQKRSLSSLN